MGETTRRLKSEIQRRGGWVLNRVQVPLAVAEALRGEGQPLPGTLGGCLVEENRSDPSGTRYLFRCLEHGRENCPSCLGTKDHAKAEAS